MGMQLSQWSMQIETVYLGKARRQDSQRQQMMLQGIYTLHSSQCRKSTADLKTDHLSVTQVTLTFPQKKYMNYRDKISTMNFYSQ